MTTTPIGQLRPVPAGLPYHPLHKRLMEALRDWFLEEIVYIHTDPRFDGEPFVWTWNQEGLGSTLRIGQWRVELHRYIPGAPSTRDPVPEWAKG